MPSSPDAASTRQLPTPIREPEVTINWPEYRLAVAKYGGTSYASIPDLIKFLRSVKTDSQIAKGTLDAVRRELEKAL